MSISTNTAARRRSTVVRFASILFAIACMAAPAMAAVGINIKDIPKLLEYEFPPQAEFEKSTKLIREVDPYQDSYLSYEFRMPNDWNEIVQQAPVSGGGPDDHLLSNSVLAIISKYVSKPKNLERSTLVIEAQEMGYEISAKNWFINFIINNGFSLSGLTEKSHKEIEAVYVALQDDITYVVRTRVMLNGSRLVMVRHYLPQENYEEDKVSQAQIVRSFHLTKETHERIEKQDTYGFLDQSYFNYPLSWKLKEKSILSIERMSALLYQETVEEKTSVLEGHIKINVISRLLKTTLAQEIERYRRDLKIPKYSVGDLIETVTYDYDPSIKVGKAQIYKLVPDDTVNMQAYEFLVTVMQGDDYYYITSLITPARDQDFYIWARNMEAAQIVNETMRRQRMSMEIDPNDPYYDYLKEEQ